MNCGATYGAISLNNVIYGALSKRIYTILLVRLRAPKLPKKPPRTSVILAFPSIDLVGCVAKHL